MDVVFIHCKNLLYNVGPVLNVGIHREGINYQVDELAHQIHTVRGGGVRDSNFTSRIAHMYIYPVKYCSSG